MVKQKRGSGIQLEDLNVGAVLEYRSAFEDEGTKTVEIARLEVINLKSGECRTMIYYTVEGNRAMALKDWELLHAMRVLDAKLVRPAAKGGG